MEADEKKATALARQGSTNFYTGEDATSTSVGQGSDESTVTICDLVTKPDTCREVLVQAVIENIKTGVFRDIVTDVRNAYALRGKEEARPIKESLPVICFSAILRHRSKDGVVRRTGLICADIDSLSAGKMDELRPRIWGDSHAYAAFASPTNSGFKVVFRYDPSSSHEAAFAAVKAYIRQEWDCEIDEACKDLPRACYYSWDPAALFNPAAIPLDVGVAKQPQAAHTPYTLLPTQTYRRRTAEEVRKVLSHIPPHPEYEPWLLVVSGVWDECGEVEGTALLKEWSPAQDPDGRDYEKKYPVRLQQIGFGTVVEMAKQHGFPGFSSASACDVASSSDGTKTTNGNRPISAVLSQVSGHLAETGLQEVEHDTSLELGTDLDASHRLVEAFHDEIRYCPELGWFSWNGKRWVEGEEKIIQRAKKTAREWTLRALDIKIESERKSAITKATTLESAGHIRGAVALAASDTRVLVPASAFDAHPWLLNVQNGTVDLRTGELLPHSRDHLLTKMARANYDPDAKHQALDRLLATISEASPDMPAFLSRCFGASLTADVSVESLFLIQGDGGAGKTTLTEGFSSMLGDYAAKLPFEALCLAKHGRSAEGATPSRLSLRGARFAFAAEGDQSARLDAGEVKMLTGGEAVTARGMYMKKPLTFLPTWKLWLISNYDPKCDSNDTGVWRRLVKLVFPVVPPEKRDPSIKHALIHDPLALAALLAWGVKGCLDWQQRGGGREGLAVPDDVLQATQAYRASQDTIGDWMADLLAEGAKKCSESWTATNQLRNHYERWCQDSGTTALVGNRWSNALRQHGLTPNRKSEARGWQGIKMP